MKPTELSSNNGAAKPQVKPNAPPISTTGSSTPQVAPVVTNVANPAASLPQPPATASSAAPPVPPAAESSSPRPGAKSPEEEMQKALAISKIQKQARRKNAFKAAQAEIHWKLFSDLDTRDEAEMLSLAVFMQTLLDVIPEGHKKDGLFSKLEKATTLKELNRDEDDGIGEPADSQKTEDDDELTLITLKSVNFSQLTGSKRMHSMIPTKTNEWDFCHMAFDVSLVQAVIEGFKAGKKLTKQSVVKVLRRCYKSVLGLKNTYQMTLDTTTKLTVVGDIHGQITDLYHILDTSGLPNANNKFIFNGDFVDRGENSFEVVFILLLMFAVYGPGIVALNRGNHEDSSVCRVYGFEEETHKKYDELIFEMFMELFNNLPLFSLVNESIFVVHGGIFHEPKVSLAELELIPRTDYFVKPAVPYPDNLAGLSEEDCYREYLKQLQRDALWSDPIAEDGCYLNHRGAGIVFGPNIARDFMKTNGLDMVIRSHECVYRGFELPFQPEMEISSEGMKQYTASEKFNAGGASRPTNNNNNANKITHQGVTPAADEEEEETPFVCTLFSASNYTHGDNFGAIIQIAPHPFAGSKLVSSKKAHTENPLHYCVKRYRTTQSNKRIVETNRTSLKELILKNKSALVSAFEAVDTTNCGTVSRLEWAEVMQRVTLIKILWLSILPSMVPANCLVGNNVVNYRLFVDAYTNSTSETDKAVGGGKPAKEGTNSVIDDFYGQRKKLETVFYFFDTNGDGVTITN
jgi:serine/threonine-protein phosphatase with EF-hand domain